MRKIIIAFDGGGTKTDILIADELGNILYQNTGRGSNHASFDGLHFKETIFNLYEDGLKTINKKTTDVDFIYLGLSGADMESDFVKLNSMCKEIFNDTKFLIVNDAWIIFRSGVKEPFGAVAICGTGTNSAAINQNGEKAILRSLSFTLGTYGGGLDIAREGLHFAFRYDELTYEYTRLYDEIPKLFNAKTMNDIVDSFYPINKVTKKEYGEVTALVFRLANEGDQICQDILKRCGSTVGLQTLGVIKQVKMENSVFPVVVGGKVFSNPKSIFMNSFLKMIQEKCPHAYIVAPKFKPVFGAYFGALDILGIKQTKEIEDNLRK